MKELLIKTLLTMAIILVAIAIVYMGIKTFLLLKGSTISGDAKEPDGRHAMKSDPFNSLIIADTSKSAQTHFFRESARKALGVVRGSDSVSKQDLDGSDFKGKEILDTLRFMNDDARSNIYIAIQYMLVSSPDGEEGMRQLSYREEVPMWMLMIREAMVKTIPNIDFSPEAAPMSVSYSKIA